jgi:hypothetical protein
MRFRSPIIAVSRSWPGERFTHAGDVAEARVAPRARLLARGLEHPVADGVAEAGLLGERDEALRQHHAALGIVPAQQRLRAVHRPVGEIDDRLVVQRELVVAQRAAQRRLDVQALRAPLGELRGEEAEAVSPELLRVVHRGVGILQQRLRVGAVVGMQGQARGCRSRGSRCPRR